MPRANRKRVSNFRRETGQLFTDYFTSWNIHMYVCNRYIYFYRAREAKCDVRNESRWQTVTAAARSRFFGERRKFPEELRGDYSSLPPLTPILALKVDTIEDTSNIRLSIFRTDFGRPVSRFILIEKLHVTLHTTLACPTWYVADVTSSFEKKKLEDDIETKWPLSRTI